MLDLLNAGACLVLMAFSLPVAFVIGAGGMWAERLSFCVLQGALFLGVANPWSLWLPPASMGQLLLTASAVLLLLVWRRRAWVFVWGYLAPPDVERKRRRTDHPHPA